MQEITKENIAEKIKELRKMKGWTQKQLANKIDSNTSAIWRFESNPSKIDDKTFNKLKKLINEHQIVHKNYFEVHNCTKIPDHIIKLFTLISEGKELDDFLDIQLNQYRQNQYNIFPYNIYTSQYNFNFFLVLKHYLLEHYLRQGINIKPKIINALDNRVEHKEILGNIKPLEEYEGLLQKQNIGLNIYFTRRIKLNIEKIDKLGFNADNIKDIEALLNTYITGFATGEILYNNLKAGANSPNLRHAFLTNGLSGFTAFLALNNKNFLFNTLFHGLIRIKHRKDKSFDSDEHFKSMQKEIPNISHPPHSFRYYSSVADGDALCYVLNHFNSFTTSIPYIKKDKKENYHINLEKILRIPYNFLYNVEMQGIDVDRAVIIGKLNELKINPNDIFFVIGMGVNSTYHERGNFYNYATEGEPDPEIMGDIIYHPIKLKDNKVYIEDKSLNKINNILDIRVGINTLRKIVYYGIGRIFLIVNSQVKLDLLIDLLKSYNYTLKSKNQEKIDINTILPATDLVILEPDS